MLTQATAALRWALAASDAERAGDVHKFERYRDSCYTCAERALRAY